MRRLANFPIILASLLLISLAIGCQQEPEADPAADKAAVQEALTKSNEWYENGNFFMAELEARKTGDDPQGQVLLFKSLAKQSDEAKQSEAETLAKALSSAHPDDTEVGKVLAAFLAERELTKQAEALKQKLAAADADKVKLLEEFPEDQRGKAYYAVAFQALDPGQAEGVSKSSPAYRYAKTYLTYEADDELAVRAKQFVANVDKLAGQAKTPKEAFQNFFADPPADLAVLKKTKVVKVDEKAGPSKGTVWADVSFTNPYTNSEDIAELVLYCSKLSGGWKVIPARSEFSSLGVLWGDKEHPVQRSGVKGIASTEDGLEKLKRELKLMPADPWKDLMKKANETGYIDKLWYSHDHDLLLLTSTGQKLLVFSTKYRLPNGLGVGDRLSEFLEVYDFQDPRDPGSPLGDISIAAGFVRNGKVDGDELVAYDLVPKGQRRPRLTVYVNGDMVGNHFIRLSQNPKDPKPRRVRAMGYIWGD